MNPTRMAVAIPHGAAAVPGERLSAERHLPRLCASGPRIWLDENTPVVGLDTAGVVVGVMFEQSTRRVTDAFEFNALTARDAATHLAGHFWGAYLAVLDIAGEGIWLMCDPSGLLPAYRCVTATHTVVVTDPRLLPQITHASPTLDTAALARFLAHPEYRGRETCLAGLDELTPGVLYGTSGKCVSGMAIWSPPDHLPQRPLPSFDEAACELRERSTAVVSAWADVFGDIVVAASGGVDSSLICGALVAAGTPFGCATLATPDPSGDERDYVALMAQWLGVPWTARTYDPARFDPAVCASLGLPRPSRRSFVTTIDALLAECAAELEAAVVFDGNGGDNMFCFLHSAAPIIDRLVVEGPGRGAFRTFLAMCRVTGADIATMARASLRRAYRGAPRARPGDDRLLSAAANACSNAPMPWHDIDVGRHRGKSDHLALIERTRNRINGLGVGPKRFSPLMSQPILEFCLGIPTWLWFEGGVNRAIARSAFANELPPALLARTSKSGPDSFIRQAFDRHRAAIRDLLLGGVLECSGLLDRPAVEEALRADIARSGSIVYRLLDLTEAENWARSWS